MGVFVIVPPMAQINLFKNYLFLTGLCAKKKKSLKKQLHKKCKYECNSLIPYLIMLSVKQGSIKYHFLSFCMTRPGIEPQSLGPLANTH